MSHINTFVNIQKIEREKKTEETENKTQFQILKIKYGN